MFSNSHRHLTFRYAQNLPHRGKNVVRHHVIQSINRPNYVINRLKNDRKKNVECWKTPPVISIVGSSRIRSTDYWFGTRLIWLCVLVASCGCFSWQLWDCSKNFYDQPIRKTVEVTRNAKIQFPAIYLCSGFMRDFLSSFFKGNLENCSPDQTCIADRLNGIIFEQFMKYIPKKKTVDEVWNFGDKDRIELYRPCMGGGKCNDMGLQKWNVENTTFKSFWDTCFLLNTVSSEDDRGPFTFFTLVYERAFFDILFQILNAELLDGAKNQSEIENLRRSRNRDRVGLMFYFHHTFNTNFGHAMFFNAHEILQGFITHVDIKKKVFERVNRRKAKCLQHEDEVIDCLNACLEKKMSKVCRMPYVLTTPDSECLLNHTDYHYRDVHQENYEVYSNFTTKHCKCNPACKEITFTPMIDVVEKLNNKSLVTVKFYFGVNSFETTTEKFAYTCTDYLSDVGGTLGYFLGGCILNVLEIIEYLFYVLKKHHYKLFM